MMMDHIGYISNDDFEIVSYCDEDGIGYYVNQKLYPFEYIEEIWERKGARLRSIFPDYKINCHIEWLEIEVNDKPIDWGLYTTSEKKEGAKGLNCGRRVIKYFGLLRASWRI